MEITLTDVQNQIINSEQIGVLSGYFKNLKIGTLLNIISTSNHRS